MSHVHYDLDVKGYFTLVAHTVFFGNRYLVSSEAKSMERFSADSLQSRRPKPLSGQLMRPFVSICCHFSAIRQKDCRPAALLTLSNSFISKISTYNQFIKSSRQIING
jgi:hypothetical protein